MAKHKRGSPMLLSLDVGLTNCKAVLFQPDGAIVDRVSVPYPTSRPQLDYVEQEPADWWQAIRKGMSVLWERNPGVATNVDVIGVTGHMHALVCLGEHGETIGPALVLGDRRAVYEAESITSSIGAAAVYRITGTEMDPSMPAAKIRWLRAKEPGRWQRVRMFLSTKDFIRHLLTGDLLTDPVDACATALYDIGAHRWSASLLEAAGARPDQLPDVRQPDSVAGYLHPASAAALGLPTGVPVVLGAGDDVDVLGFGLLRTGDAMEHLGTTGSIMAVVDTPVYDEKMALELYPHALAGLWVLGGSTTTAGASLAWAAQLLHLAEPGQTVACPESREAAVFLPHLAGERCPDRHPAARGAWFDLDLELSNAQLMRAVFEGVAYSLKSVLERIEGLLGPVHRIRVGDGNSDQRWLQLRADIYERPMACIGSPEPTSLGLMTLAAASVGLYPDVPSAVDAMATRPLSVVAPQAQLRTVRRDIYTRYQILSDLMAPLWPEFVKTR